MWLMWHGQRKASHTNTHEGNSHMSKLRQSFLIIIRTLGNHSGCHQMPERSFFYHGKQFPVCARCTGVFFGFLAAVFLLLFHRILPTKFAAFLLALMGVDWGLQALNIKESTNCRRAVTGFAGGLGLYSLYFRVFYMILF